MEQNNKETRREQNLRVTRSVLQIMNELDIKNALVVCCNIAGHLIAAMSTGNPSALMANAKSVSDIMRKAAIDKRRKEKT